MMVGNGREEEEVPNCADSLSFAMSKQRNRSSRALRLPDQTRGKRLVAESRSRSADFSPETRTSTLRFAGLFRESEWLDTKATARVLVANLVFTLERTVLNG